MSPIDDCDDPLAPARGVFNGVLLGLALWALLLLLLAVLTGCEDKAYPLDCLNVCGHRVALVHPPRRG